VLKNASFVPTRGWAKRFPPKSSANLLRSRRLILTVCGLCLLLLLILLLKTDHGPPAAELQNAPSANKGQPFFITPPGETDILFVVTGVGLVGAIFGFGAFFFWLHSLPERLVHKSTKVHYDIVAVLALLSLFTHIHLFWVAALLLALVRIPHFSIPDFAGFLGRIAISLERMAARNRARSFGSSSKSDNLPPSQGS